MIRDLIRELLELEGITAPGWSGRNVAILRLAWRMFVELAVLIALLCAFVGLTLLAWAGTSIPEVR